MAEDSDDEERSEDPSPRRLQQAYDEGDLPLGRDAVAVAGLAAGVVAMIAAGRGLLHALFTTFAQTFSRLDVAPNFRDFVNASTPVLGYLSLIVAAAAVAGVAVTMLQTGAGIWPDKVLPDISRLFDLQRVTKPFTRDFYIDFALMTLKVALLGWAGWTGIRDQLASIGGSFEVPVGELLPMLFGPMSRTVLRIVGILVAMAAADWWLSRYRFMQKMKMTKQELKREVKEEEGDPLIKSRRKRKARELMRARARQEVPKADVLVVNPTHLAIAIRYRKDEGQAPRVTAKGAGPLAELMRDLARTNGVPIVEDIALARLLFRRVKVGAQVPAQTYRAVAAILVFVYKVTGRRPE